MAFLYVTELATLPQLDAGGNMIVQAPVVGSVKGIIAEQQVAIGGGSVQSAAFNANTKFVMTNTDAICSLAWGTAPTAVNTAHRVSANETRFYGVSPGDKVAVITNT